MINNEQVSRIWTIFTARIRRATGGCVFTDVCPFSFVGGRGGIPHPADREVYPILGPDGGTPSWAQTGGYLIQDQDRGYPHQGLDGSTPLWDWIGYPPPVQDWMGYLPHPGLDGVPLPLSGWGTPIQDSQWVTHPGLPMGYPSTPHPTRTDGVPPVQDWIG